MWLIRYSILSILVLCSTNLLLRGSTALADTPAPAPEPITDLPRLDTNFGLTFKTEVSEDGMRWGHGTGEVIWHDGYILTQYHVVDDAKFIRIRVPKPDGTVVTLTGTVVASDPAVDLAVFKVPYRFSGEVELEDPATIKVGDLIYNVGFPYSAGKSVDRGYIKQLDLHPDPTDPDHAVRSRMFMEIPDGHGTSGSGIYSMTTGHLVGTMMAYVAFGRDRSPLYVRMAVPVTTVKDFLDRKDMPYRSAALPAGELRMRNPHR
jgi:S1-C subfamily serine protease